MDGTEEQGNRMSEENLGKIMGPNILHKVGGAGEGMGKEGKGREERTKGGEGGEDEGRGGEGEVKGMLG